MTPRRRHAALLPPLLLLALVLVLAGSALGGWFVASRVAPDAPVASTPPERAEPPYDAGDPTEPPPAPAPAAAPPRGDAHPTRPPGRTAGSRAAVPADADGRQPAGAPAPPAPDAADAPPATGAPDPPAEPARPDPTTTPYAPPPAMGIAASALPPEGAALGLLLAARRRAPPASQEQRDIDWLVEFARAAAAPGRPEGRRATARRALRVNAWWYASRQAPDARVIARDPDGIILTYKRGHGFMVNPVATMGRWRGLNDLWSPAQLAEALLPMLVERVDDGREWAALEYFDVPGEPDAVQPGVSGMGQARAASLFARAFDTTGDPRFLGAAERVLRSFSVPVDRGGVLAQVPDPDGGAPAPWYPERAYPGRPAWTGAALNGFMVTLIELRRAAAMAAGGQAAGAAEQPTTVEAATTGTVPPAGEGPGAPDGLAARAAVARAATGIAARGERSLRRFLALHDSGTWSYYGLLTPGRPWRTYLADLNYHCYHVTLLGSLDDLFPGRGYGTVARRWQGYVDVRGAECPAR